MDETYLSIRSWIISTCCTSNRSKALEILQRLHSVTRDKRIIKQTIIDELYKHHGCFVALGGRNSR